MPESLYRILSLAFQHLIWGGELESMIHEMVLGMDAGDYLGVPLTR